MRKKQRQTTATLGRPQVRAAYAALRSALRSACELRAILLYFLAKSNDACVQSASAFLLLMSCVLLM